MWSVARRSLSTGQYKKYLTLLDVKKDSTPKEIKDSFLRLSKIYHPDNKLTGSHKKFVELNEAYEALKDGIKPSHTTHSQPGQAPRQAPGYRPGHRPAESVDMYHVYNVFKTLNRVEEEVPRFRPFDDHNYPGTQINRFEYTRFYDREAGTWVYMKKGTYANYRRQMNEKGKILMTCIFVGTFGTLIFTGSHNNIFGLSPAPKIEDKRTQMQKDIEEFKAMNPTR